MSDTIEPSVTEEVTEESTRETNDATTNATTSYGNATTTDGARGTTRRIIHGWLGRSRTSITA